MKKYLRFALAAGLLVTSAFVLGGSASTAKAVTSLPTFGQPTINGIQGMGFELGLRNDPTNPNRIYTSAPGSGGSASSWIWHSEDGGKTFKWVTAATPTQGKIGDCAGGGDTELAVDTAGHLYFADLSAANFSVARSDDAGVSFHGIPGTQCNNTAVPDAVVDRPWYATDGDPTNGGNIYLASNEIDRDQPVCGSSNEGNNTLVMYRSPLPAAGSLAGVQFGPAKVITAAVSCGEGIMGNVEVSSKTHHVFVIHDNAFLDSVAIARCTAVSFLTDPSGLTCTDVTIASFPGFKTAGNFPNMTIDKNGNLYAVWEQAPIEASTGYVIGDTVLKYSYSTNDGSTWSTPITLPTTLPSGAQLHNNVYAFPAAGDDGRVDIAWYGTTATANDDDQLCGRNPDPTLRAENGNIGTPLGGPDAVTSGTWSVYMVQTLNGHAGTPTFTAPILAGEHHIHKGSLQTIIGGLCGNRSLGDFLQMRIGSKGEAEISYADSNSIAGTLEGTHGMFVRQNGGTGVFGATSPVSGDPILINSATDSSGDGKLEAGGTSTDNLPNLDILDSSMSKPAPSDCHPANTPCYRVKMTIADLTSISPAPVLGQSDQDLAWLTQWFVPAAPGCADTNLQSACQSGGKNFIVFAESYQGADPVCYSGESETIENGAAPTLTYPGSKQITDPGGCSFVRGAPGSITIDVPITDVSLQPDADPLDATLYSVTASTMTLAEPTSASTPFGPLAGLGGIEFNLIDVVRAYDANFTPPPTATLTLAASTNNLVVGKHECVTATVKTAAGNPASGVSVPFKVTGVNPTGATKSTNPSGLATFCYEGHKVGVDTITAYADFNKNKVKDSTEPSDTASVTWTH